MNMEMSKKQKVESTTMRSLFSKLPDEMVLTILSYGTMEDITSTRVWQSKKVQHFTETITNYEASENNNLDNLKWIYGFIGYTDLTFKVLLNCTVMALHHKNYEMMEWLNDKGCRIDEWTFAHTASHGSIESLELLKKNECPWNENTFHCAAAHGNLENMEWLKLNACPWSEHTFSFAVDQGNINVMEWLKRNGCPMADLIPSKNHMEDETIVTWFNNNGYTVEERFGFVKIQNE